jgi:ACS family glucarate transporter-like MFS transporter
VTPARSLRPAPQNVASLWRSRRLFIALFLFTNLCLNYGHRMTLSIAAPSIAKQFGWNPADMGLMFSSFMWTYAFCITPWGMLADRIGTRKVNGISVLIWSIAGMLTGAASAFSTMLLTRLVLGVGEAASMPSCGKVVRQWFPASERGLATAIFNAGTFAGPAFSAPAVAWLILRIGWRTTFAIAGASGIVWVALWLRYFRDPHECAWISEAERDYILSSTPPKIAASTPAGALGKLLRHRTMWGLFITQGCIAYAMFIYLLWLPSWLVQERHMDLMQASWFTAIPYITAAVLGVVIGKFSDSLLNPESLRQGRRRAIVLVFTLLSCSIIFTNSLENQNAMLVLISVVLTCVSSALTLNIAYTSDLVWDPAMVGTALGISILGGIVFGIAAPVVTGYIVKASGSFNGAFYVSGALLLLGALTSLTLTRRPLAFEAN